MIVKHSQSVKLMILQIQQLMIFICVIDSVLRVHEEVVSLCCLNGITNDKVLILKQKVKLIEKIDMTTNSDKIKVYGPETGRKVMRLIFF